MESVANLETSTVNEAGHGGDDSDKESRAI